MDKDLYERGLKTAYAKGYTGRSAQIYAEEYVKEYLRSIRAVMKTVRVSCERAMDLLEVPEEVREDLVRQLKQE